jgi:hypothetical protein
MNDLASFVDKWPAGPKRLSQCTNRERFPMAGTGGATMSGMTAFLIAVGGVSAVSFWLLTRGQNRSTARKSSYDSSDTDASCTSEGWSIFGWFGVDKFVHRHSGSSSDFSSGDSGGGGGD